MRKVSAFAGVALLLAGPAFAADLAVPEPVYKAPVYKAPPVYSWTGWYAGGNAGYNWSHGSVDSVANPSFVNPADPTGAGAIAQALAALGTYSRDVHNNGFIGGIQAGYNWQFNSWVAGFEADIQGIAHRNTTASQALTVGVPGFPESYAAVRTVERQVDWLGTIRGRAGLLATPSLLAYGTGGLAYGGVKTGTSVTGQESLGPGVYEPLSGGVFSSETRFGWTAGGGFEWLFAPNWSAKAEYLYYDLGKKNSSYNLVQSCVPGACADPAAGPWGGASVHTSTRFNGNIMRAGINYHF
jgi:outer membrane immunogenic protein